MLNLLVFWKVALRLDAQDLLITSPISGLWVPGNSATFGIYYTHGHTHFSHSCTHHKAFALATAGGRIMDWMGSCSDPVQNLSFPDHILEHLTIYHKSLGTSLAGVINLWPLRQHNYFSLLFQSHSPTQQISVSPSPCHYPRWCFIGSGGSETPLCLEIPLKKVGYCLLQVFMYNKKVFSFLSICQHSVKTFDMWR